MDFLSISEIDLTILKKKKEPTLGGGYGRMGEEVRELRSTNKALAGVAQWIECWPVN